MRSLGYGEVQDRRATETSYSRKLSTDRYPRYHAYLNEIPNGLVIKLHVDQKKASYEGQTAHSGEYTGPLVQREIDRIKSELARLAQ